jgi:hypothetical protein
MTKPLSNQKNINTNGIKTNKDIEIPMDSNIDPKKCDDNLLHDIFLIYLQYQVIQKTTLVNMITLIIGLKTSN